MARFASTWRAFALDIQKVALMSQSDVENRIDPSIDFDTVKNIPGLARGKFVRLKGKVSDIGLKKAFAPVEDDEENFEKVKKEETDQPDTSSFVLDGAIAIFCTDEFKWLAEGDTVEITGMVSRTSIFKFQKQVTPEMPDYEVIVAKTVKKV